MGAAAAITVIGAVKAFLDARGQREAQRAAEDEGATTPGTPRLAMPTVSTRGPYVDFALVRVTFR